MTTDGLANARMRLAYTQATVNFPRSLNVLPISNEVYTIFEQVYLDLGGAPKLLRYLDPLDQKMIQAMTKVVGAAVDEIRCKGIPAEVTAGMSPPMAKQFMGLVAGLDREAANRLIVFARTRGVTPDQVKAQRYVLLTMRWNICANKTAKEAVSDAREYFRNGSGNESDSG